MTKEEVIEILERFVIGAKPCSQREIVDACASAYTMLKEQPSLPSNLDEAAQKVEDYYDVGEEHGYLWCYRGDIKDAFKAGAEWMAMQGQTNVELEEEITRWLEKGDITDTRFDDYDDADIERTARHFYELGLNARKK